MLEGFHNAVVYGTQHTVPWGLCPGPSAGAEDSITGPAHADFGGLSSGAPPLVVLLDVVPLPPRSSAQTVELNWQPSVRRFVRDCWN